MTRLVICSKGFACCTFKFAITWCRLPTSADIDLQLLSKNVGSVRHLDFDWVLGNFGRDCVLLEISNASSESLVDSSFGTVDFVLFQNAAARLSDREDKRYLQLAVQFLAQGGIVDTSLATIVDESLLETLKNNYFTDN